MSEVFYADRRLTYTYKRTTGPVLGRFFTGLRDGRIEAVVAADGTVLCPPTEYDPRTSESLLDAPWVEVGPGSVVQTWSWVDQPRPTHPLPSPFAWALVTLDGASTPMLHAVDTGGDPTALANGARVTVRWAQDRVGQIRDIECFVPEGAQQ